MAKKEPEYYTILLDKFLELMKDTEKYYYMVNQELKDLVTKTELDTWAVSPIPDFMETAVILMSMKTLLNKKLNEPTDEEVKFCKDNKIKDVLITKEELVILQKFVMALEDQKELLLREYKFNYLLN